MTWRKVTDDEVVTRTVLDDAGACARDRVLTVMRAAWRAWVRGATVADVRAM